MEDMIYAEAYTALTLDWRLCIDVVQLNLLRNCLVLRADVSRISWTNLSKIP